MHKKTKTFYNLEFRTERIVERERKRNNARPSDRGQARPGEGRGPLALAERLVGTAVFYCDTSIAPNALYGNSNCPVSAVAPRTSFCLYFFLLIWRRQTANPASGTQKQRERERERGVKQVWDSHFKGKTYTYKRQCEGGSQSQGTKKLARKWQGTREEEDNDALLLLLALARS